LGHVLRGDFDVQLWKAEWRGGEGAEECYDAGLDEVHRHGICTWRGESRTRLDLPNRLSTRRRNRLFWCRVAE